MESLGQGELFVHDIRSWGSVERCYQWIESGRRPSVMEIWDDFNSSGSFDLELLDELTHTQNSGLCKTFTCRITSIDERSTADLSPILCVKLYDDRFYPMDQPSEDLGDCRWWWTHKFRTKTWRTSGLQRCRDHLYHDIMAPIS